MGIAARLSVALVTTGTLVLGTVGALPAAADQPGTNGTTITCSVEAPGVTAPGQPVETIADTPVAGKVTCTHSGGAPVTLKVAKYVINEFGPFVGKLAFAADGAFTYTPGWYPPDEEGKVEQLPEYTGNDSFTVEATAPDQASASFEVPIKILPKPRSCDPNFTPTTRTMFNDPSGTVDEQYQMLRYLISMIDCTPPTNPDGSQATIQFSFFSLTYAPVQAALTAAAQRGVAVQAITNSHSDKYGSWQVLANDLGGDATQPSFATTCWQGCLTPRPGPVPGGPTAWYAADATSLVSNTVVFSDRSIPGTNGPIMNWHYEFGDGTSADGPGPHVKTYASPGLYSTSLTVTDAAGVTHTTTGNKMLPDNEEPEYPSLHAKIYLFSTVGYDPSHQRRWISGYSSGNPTYFQSRKGFNNLNIAVEDKSLYDIFHGYMHDLVTASRGLYFTDNYFRTFSTPGNSASGAPATMVHFGPQTSGDINRDVLKSIQCRYKQGKTWKRTYVRVSMFVFTRSAVARDLWKKAMREGCNVEVVYTQMSQRIKAPDGSWLTKSDGEPTGYGVADCLSTPPTKVVVKPATKRKPARRVVRMNNFKGPDGLCSGGSLRGYVPVTTTGMWLDRTSPITGGRLRVRMSCPVAPEFDTVTKVWVVTCIRSDIYTHNKTMLVNGVIHGKRQKYVMSGSSNWSSPGLRSSDEVITEMQDAPALYKQYRKNFDYLKAVVAKNSATPPKKKKKFVLQLSGSQQLDVRGLTDEQLAGQL